ncbi:hypothetical protein [Oryzifoliimicrobium ureilyticus]|uniref:hypothetical protein n=1 Tax=Oryzifoliimicrobium ureilyticus TaxID=3113724 RepID=UPI0030763E37
MASLMSVAALAVGLTTGVAPQDQGHVFAVQISNDCSDAADKVVEKTGGQLLSVQPSGDSCIITVIVQGQGQRPRKITVKVPM